jgi:hypothetical protein
LVFRVSFVIAPSVFPGDEKEESATVKVWNYLWPGYANEQVTHDGRSRPQDGSPALPISRHDALDKGKSPVAEMVDHLDRQNT